MTFMLHTLARLMMIGAHTSIPMCLGTGGGVEPSYAALRVAYMVKLVTATDSAMSAKRQRYGLPTLQSSDVTLVTDEAICTRAARAYADIALANPVTPVPVYVIRVGATRYYVSSPEVLAGEYSPQLIFSNTFARIAGFAG
jgi:hypothetical protein